MVWIKKSEFVRDFARRNIEITKDFKELQGLASNCFFSELSLVRYNSVSGLSMPIRRISHLTIPALGVFLLLSGCSKENSTQPTDSSGSFGLLKKKVFDQSCATSGCHTVVSKAGGMVLEGSDAYSNLINVPPSNTASRNAGFVRVNPWQPGKSFLFLKTEQSVLSDYGDRMPQNSTLGLGPSAHEFIRQWIAAGAPETGDVADKRLLDEPAIPSNPFTAPAPPTQGLQLHLRPFAINPGTEREIFVYNEPTLQDTLYVNRVDISMREGSHHFILYKFRGIGIVQQDVVRDFNSSTLLQEMQIAAYRDFLIGTQTPSFSYTLPDNVVLPLAPGQGFDLNTHYTNNAGTSTLIGEAYVNLYTIKKSATSIVAKPIFDNNFAFSLPPRQQTLVQRTVLYNSARDVFLFSSHNHKRGQSFKIYLVGGPNNGKLVYENYTWDHPPTKTFSPPIHFETGWGYRIEVGYSNETDRTIGFGFTSEDEMCIVLGYYY